MKRLKIDIPCLLPTRHGNLTIAYLLDKDLDAWCELEQGHHHQPWSASNIRSSLEAHICLGLRFQEQLIGHAVLNIALDEAELLLFVLHKDWRGKGVAAAFLRTLLSATAAHAQRMYLEVRASNSPAINLYEACGFNQVGTRPNYYPAKNGRAEDALIFAMELC